MRISEAIKSAYRALDRMNRELIELKENGDFTEIEKKEKKIEDLWIEVKKLEVQEKEDWDLQNPQHLYT